MQVDNRQFRMLCSYLCSGLGCSRFSRFCWALGVRFSLLVGWAVRACGYGRYCYGLSLELPRNVLRRLTRAISPISYAASPFHQICRVQKCCKTAFVRLKLQENGYPIQSESLTIQVIPHRLSSFPYRLFHTVTNPNKRSTRG